MTIAHLDALDHFMDAVRAYIAAHNETVSADLRDSYWQVRSGIDALREMVQPAAIYPQPAPVENCAHPYDRDFAFLNYDTIEDDWYITRCCCVCGHVGESYRIGPRKRKRKKKEATP